MPAPAKTAAPLKISAPTSQGMALMLGSVVFFSASILVIKAIHEHYGLSFWVITLPRFVVGLLMIQLLFRGEQCVQWVTLFTNPWMIARGIIGGIGVPLYNLCVIEIGAGRTTILNASYPIFGMLLAPLFLPEKLRWRALGLAALAIGGIAVMTGRTAFAIGPAPYDALAVTVAFCSGMVVVIIRKLHATSNTATIFAAQCFYGLLFCIPGFLSGMQCIGPIPIALILTAAALVAVGQLMLTQSFRSVSVARGSSVQLMGPPLVAAASFGFFGERLALHELVGGGIILLACYRIARAPD